MQTDEFIRYVFSRRFPIMTNIQQQWVDWMSLVNNSNVCLNPQKLEGDRQSGKTSFIEMFVSLEAFLYSNKNIAYIHQDKNPRVSNKIVNNIGFLCLCLSKCLDCEIDVRDIVVRYNSSKITLSNNSSIILIQASNHISTRGLTLNNVFIDCHDRQLNSKIIQEVAPTLCSSNGSILYTTFKN